MQKLVMTLGGLFLVLGLLVRPSVVEAGVSCIDCIFTCWDGKCIQKQAECFCLRKLPPDPVPPLIAPPLPPIGQAPKVSAKIAKLSSKLAVRLTKCGVKVVLGKKESADGGAACEAAARAKFDAALSKLQVKATTSLTCGMDGFTVPNIARELVRSALAASAICPADCTTVCASDLATVCASNADCAVANDCGVLSCP